MSFMNSRHANMRFTYETETDNRISFIGLTIEHSRLITHMVIKHQFTKNLHRRRFLLISIVSHHWYIDCLYLNVSFTVHIIYALRGAYFILKLQKFEQYFYVMLFQPGFLIE